jgi:hypothetical protein
MLGNSSKAAKFSQRDSGENLCDAGVSELFGIRPIAVSEARVVRSDHAIAIGEAGEKRLEHSRRRRQTVQQQECWRVSRTSLPVEN